MDDNENIEETEGAPTPITELTEIADIEAAANVRLDEFNELKGKKDRTSIDNARIVELTEEMQTLAAALTAARETEAAANAAEAPSFEAPEPEAGDEPTEEPEAPESSADAPAEEPAEQPEASNEPAEGADAPSPDSEAELQAAQAALDAAGGTPTGDAPKPTGPAMNAPVEWHAASAGGGNGGSTAVMDVEALTSRMNDFFGSRPVKMNESTITIAQAKRPTTTPVLGDDITGDLEMATAVGWHTPAPGDGIDLDLANCCIDDTAIVWEQDPEYCDGVRPIHDWLIKANATRGCQFRVKLKRDPITGTYFRWNYDCDDAEVGLVAEDGTITTYDATDDETWKTVNLVENRACDVYLIYNLQGHGFNMEQSRARMLCDPGAWDEAYTWLERGYFDLREAQHMQSFSTAARISGAHFAVTGVGPSARSDIRAMLAEILPGIRSQYCMNFDDATVITERGVREWLDVEKERDPSGATLSSLDAMFRDAGIGGGFLETRTVIPGTTPNFPNHASPSTLADVGTTTGNIKASDAVKDPYPGPIEVEIDNVRTITFLVVKRNNFRLLQGPGQRLSIREERNMALGNMDRFAQYEDDEVLIPRTNTVDAVQIDITLGNAGGRSCCSQVVDYSGEPFVEA